MYTNIKCPKCGTEIEITEALQKDVEERLRCEMQADHTTEIKKLQEAKQIEIDNIKAENEKRFEESKEKIIKEAEAKALENTSKDIKDKDDQIAKLTERAKQAEDQELKIRKEKRELEEAKNKFELEKQRQIDEERTEIRKAAFKEALEGHELKDKEKDLIIENLKRAVAEAQRKAQQGSQQMQGEAQEELLENFLKRVFPFDQTKEVPKGVKGADTIQIVCNNRGTPCGTILWESKNTKTWSNGWMQKIKDDQRAVRAEIAVIVSKVLPDNIKNLGFEEGIFICDLSSVIGIACALRERLIAVHAANIANQGKATKAEVVYNYLTSNEFKQRIEVWVEYFRNRNEEIDKEIAYFTKKWDKEKKSIGKVFQNTAGIYGDLQGLIGNALPKVPYLELPEEISED